MDFVLFAADVTDCVAVYSTVAPLSDDVVVYRSLTCILSLIIIIPILLAPHTPFVLRLKEDYY